MSNIDLKQLKHFVALAEELHFGRAAKRCNISQPPFSLSIQKLEHELGFQLFERSSHNVKLTNTGAVYYSEISKALAQISHSTEIALRVNAGYDGVLKVGFFTSMLFRGLDAAVSSFQQEYPNIVLELIELNTVEQIEAIQKREIDYGFLHSEFAGDEIEIRELIREPLMLCLSSNHKMAKKKCADLSDFKFEPFIIFTRNKSPMFFDQLVTSCVQSGFNPIIRYQARNWLTIVFCISKDMGITLVPKSLSNTKLPGVTFIKVKPSAMESVVSSAWRKDNVGNQALKNWHDCVLRHLPSSE